MKYKVVKVISEHTGNTLYKIYRHRFWFFWKFIKFEFTLEDAEKCILKDKKEQSWKKTKPEVVGYYE